MIEVRDLSKDFGEIKAVDRLSFSCKPGAIYGLLGANGAGKTTTIRILATMLQPTEGTIRINSYDVVKEGHLVRKSIGVLFGETGLYHRLTAEENIRYFAKLYDVPDKIASERMDELFSLLDMQNYRKRKTGDFSKGMKQKVNIVRSVIHDPPVLLFDEPTAGLDVMSARVVTEFISNCRDRGKCVLFSTHIMSEAESLCDRIGIVNRGALVAEESVSGLLGLSGQRTLEDAFIRLVGKEYAVATC